MVTKSKQNRLVVTGKVVDTCCMTNICWHFNLSARLSSAQSRRCVRNADLVWRSGEMSKPPILKPVKEWKSMLKSRMAPGASKYRQKSLACEFSPDEEQILGDDFSSCRTLGQHGEALSQRQVYKEEKQIKPVFRRRELYSAASNPKI